MGFDSRDGRFRSGGTDGVLCVSSAVLCSVRVGMRGWETSAALCGLGGGMFSSVGWRDLFGFVAWEDGAS